MGMSISAVGLARLVLVITWVIGIALLGASPAESADDPRFFPQTRYRIDDDRFWDFFQRRGGVRTFGYPVSGTFQLLGLRVQIFQRQVMQLQPDGGVATMNLLDEGLMPYTKINGSEFPAPDPNLLKDSPNVGERDYHARAVQFVRDHAPDVWQGLPVNFFGTFSSTIRVEDAFAGGRGDQGLLPGFNLEMWGLPTSRPTPDPTNGGFIYQRFQRGIMHYDAACGCTQGLLLGQYLKSIMTLRDLPSDLEAQARASRFYAQFNPGAGGKLNRPKDLPGSDLTNAFIREPVVVVDAGHGGKEIGASYSFADGFKLLEKDLNLKVATRLGPLLTDSGHAVVFTRTADRDVNDPPRDLTGDDKITLADELQARVDVANAAGADLFLSIHFNGVSNPDIRGTQVFYSDGRDLTDRSRALAEIVDASLVKALSEAGYQTIDRKATTDSSILGGGDTHFYLLGPGSKTIKRPSNMPGVIGEALYVTNESDANALRQDRILEAVARGYAEAVKQYFARFPVG
jgi:N-acetylmuramoyl-L-alanine amidase